MRICLQTVHGVGYRATGRTHMRISIRTKSNLFLAGLLLLTVSMLSLLYLVR